MNSETWPDRLQCLIAHFAYLGVSPDLAGYSIIEAWGLYRCLSRLADGS